MIFFLFCVITLGVIGFFSVAASGKSVEQVSIVSAEYEIIEDNA